mmetsp:Transcript_23792/g.27521  ORF Transcript_23792/g.27521 Transcript_23792/m.27521 type:complete len:447 (+) Transcript_23792:107-1447(+)
MSSSSNDWTSSIYEATICLREQDVTFLEPCLSYLDELEQQLHLIQDESMEDHDEHNLNHVDGWSFQPTKPPPDWNLFQKHYQRNEDESNATLAASGSRVRNHRNHNNQETLLFNFNNNKSNRSTIGHKECLDCRRILIRILTFQSECLALKASSLRASQQWKLGAEQYHGSLRKIHAALDVADTEISRWILMEQKHPSTDHHLKKQHLIQDANIVEVAIESLTKGREKFLELSFKEHAYLLRKLEPQWESRDQVKQRWGENRWKNNPRPKHDYSKLRKEFEIRCKDVKGALEVLQTIDTTQVEEKRLQLQKQLESNIHGNGGVDIVLLQRRYNGQRPDSNVLKRRVPFDEYPDATEFGWTFTGSWDAVEFFEKDDIKLDWYFTTATVKTSLEHPTQGKTQLFRKSVDKILYREILENPRVHTDQGYQRRKRRDMTEKRQEARLYPP